MFTEDFSFPHPVLGMGDDMTGSFEVTLKVKRHEEQRMLRFYNIVYTINNAYILNLVETGLADFLVKVYCGPTFKTWTFKNPGESFSIDENDIFSKVEVQVFVIARENIPNYSDASFNSHFSGHTFNIAEHEVLAICGRFTLPIEKTDENLSFGNIFKFCEQEANQPLYFTYTQDKIHVYCSKADSVYPPSFLFHSLRWTAYSIFILPAITGAFQLLKNPEERHDYENFEWYSVIRDLMPENKWDNNDPFVNAQILIGKGLPYLQCYTELNSNSPA